MWNVFLFFRVRVCFVLSRPHCASTVLLDINTGDITTVKCQHLIASVRHNPWSCLPKILLLLMLNLGCSPKSSKRQIKLIAWNPDKFQVLAISLASIFSNSCDAFVIWCIMQDIKEELGRSPRQQKNTKRKQKQKQQKTLYNALSGEPGAVHSHWNRAWSPHGYPGYGL